MPVITFPDGSQRNFAYPVSVMDIALAIDLKLAQSCIAGHVNNKIVDTIDIITEDSQVKIILEKDKESLEIIRRSCMHLLGYTIKNLWPDAKMATNQVTDNGFYYDIDLNQVLTQKDINKIENFMQQLTTMKHNFVKKEVNWQYARNLFTKYCETYKITMLDENFNKESCIILYYQENYVDLYQGPLVPNTDFCQYFKIQKISGAYWKDNKENKMLQRIYGSAWSCKNQLISHLKNVEEISKRDHRKISKQLDLYHLQEDSPGLVFWHNNGWNIFLELKSFLRSKLKEYNYQEVKTPFMMDRILWEKTGHWENYKESIFSTSSENREYCIKPMNCPGHIQIFNQGLKSYRDLPLRMAEFGSCHRNESSGSLHGLMRVRGFTQDDAHIFCTEDQVRDEVTHCILMAYDVYSTFGFKKISVKLSTRPQKRIGNDKNWQRAEEDLVLALQENNIKFEYQPGEGAFYGPKIEFTLYDFLDRSWQCGTIQLDLFLTQCLNATYIDKHNYRRHPVIIHRAILGSIERFIGILIEEYAGFFPIWLAPTQIVVINLTHNEERYVNDLEKKFRSFGFRVNADLRNEKIGFKIRQHTLNRVPYILVCGSKEVESSKISVRTCRNKDLKIMNIDIFVEKLQKEINSRCLYPLEE